MNRSSRMFPKQLISLVLPVTALVIVPLIIERNFTVSLDITAVIGLIFIVSGMTVIIVTVSMFIRIGRGTLAPWSPTRNLVTTGMYAYVRNPMISGVFIVLIGESLLFYSFNILIWALAFFVINTIYFILSEEPGLKKRFGEEYSEYKRNVPMWIPRLKPWTPSDKRNSDYN